MIFTADDCEKLISEALSDFKKEIEIIKLDTQLGPICEKEAPNETFVKKETEEPIETSDYAVLSCGNGWQDVEALWS